MPAFLRLCGFLLLAMVAGLIWAHSESTAGPDARQTQNNSTPVEVFGLGEPLDSDGDGCPDSQELQTEEGSELSGGRRDPANPWDYFNPTNDGENRVDDIVAVLNRYYSTGDPFDDLHTDPPPEPIYHSKFDRTYLGPDPWNLWLGDGRILVDDILFAVHSYFHDCGTGVAKVPPLHTPTPDPWPPCVPGAFVPGELLVSFQPGTTPERVTELVEEVGASVIRFLFDLYGPTYKVAVPMGQEYAFVSLFQAYPEVRYAQPNYIICPLRSPPSVRTPPAPSLGP